MEYKDFNQEASIVEQKPSIDNLKPILVDNDTELPNLLKVDIK